MRKPQALTLHKICAIKASQKLVLAQQMKDFDLNLLRVLIALHRSRSVSRAATELGLSQSATSLSLGRLRKIFDDPLFVRSRSGMLPTVRCTEATQAAARAIAGFSDHVLLGPVFEPLETRRDFVVTMVDVGELHFLPRLMGWLHREAPHCNVRCETFAADDLENALGDGRCDLALGFFSSLAPTTLCRMQLSTHPFVCLVRAGHPHATSSRFEMSQFLAMSHLLVHPGGLSQELFETKLKELGYSRRIQLRTPHFLSVASIIAATDMVVTVPLSVADYYAKVENLRIVEPPVDFGRFPLRMFWHPRLQEDPAVHWLREAIIKLFASGEMEAPGHPPSRPRASNAGNLGDTHD